MKPPITTALGLIAAGAASAQPTATRAPFGVAADGRVELITLTNDHGLRVRVSTRGGAIVEVLAPDRHGRLENIVLSHQDFAAWEKAGAFNTIVGRYANRIGRGGFTLDGARYPLAGVNPKTGVVLHGGPRAFASRIWRAEPFARGDAAGVVFTLRSPDGDNGYPGALDVTVTYTLTNADVLRLDYAATTTKPTVVNLTNHSYWTLGGHASGPVYDQRLRVAASRYTPTDASQIPTGALTDMAGTPFDFRTEMRLGDRLHSPDPQMLLALGLDHNFVLDGGVTTAPRPVVWLHDPASGRRLEVRTTEPGVQIYAGNHLDGSAIAADGRTMRQSDGIAFETQHYPDSPNQPAFPSTVLRPGERFHSVTEFAFSVDAG